MRTEVKIGIIIGLVVFATGVIFFLNQNKSGDVADAVPWRKDSGPATTDAAKPARRDQTNAASPRTPNGRPTGQHPAPVTPPRTGRDAEPAARPGERPALPPGARSPDTPTTQPAFPPRSRIGPTDGPGSPPSTTPPRGDTPPLPVAGPRPIEPPPSPPPTSQPAPREPVATSQPAPAAPPRYSPGPATPAVPPPPRQEPEGAGGRPGTRLPTPSAAVTKHTIETGDSLWAIAARYYEDGSLWPRIKAANPGLDEGRLLVGQQIVIPPKEEPATANGAGRAPTPEARPTPGGNPPGARPAEPRARRHTYVVERGDTLINIARNLLKDGARWRDIYELNKEKIADPDRLLVGVELRIPAE